MLKNLEELISEQAVFSLSGWACMLLIQGMIYTYINFVPM